MDENTETSKTPGNGADILINLEGLIKSHISSTTRLQEEYDKHRSMLDDIFNNDATYKKLSEESKEASRKKGAQKQQILKNPQAADLNSKVQSMKSEIKEIQGALSDYLKEFQRMSGVNEIEGDDGEVREIVYDARLVKKSSTYRH
ncbi:MAG: hypothetical protein Q7S88_01610 [Candidatus Daviesbacteria bacterium]|nr:hypothetical protein [Candidatus Daviesbacteria bacterium]